MSQEIKIPSVGESVLEVTIAEWSKKNGDSVSTGDVLLVLETDKASVEITAESSGVLKILKPEGSTIPIGSQVGLLEPSTKTQKQETHKAQTVLKKPTKPQVTQTLKTEVPQQKSSQPEIPEDMLRKLPPSLRHLLLNQPDQVKQDLLQPTTKEAIKNKPPSQFTSQDPQQVSQRVPQKTEIKPLSTIRKTIARRLKEVQNTAAILTTFNEVDLTDTMKVRAKYQEEFTKKHGVKLGLMSLFVKASIEGLKEFPLVNGFIKEDHLVYNHFYNIGVAVSTPRGLIVPVLKDADQMSLAKIELQIKKFALDAKEGKVSMDDLSGGTFTITNGGVFGSMMSTPILNPPQSGILGMHAISDRPFVIDGQITIRKMMYLALSYDHRIIDGREAVGFLVKIKESMQDIRKLLLQI